MSQNSRAVVRRTLAGARTVAPVLAALALGISSAASAATFHVAAGGSGPCTTATTCGSIQDAIVAARATAEHDVVDVAAGAYSQRFALSDATDAGIVVQGVGSGTDPAHATIVTAPDNADTTVSVGTSSDAAGITVRGMRLRAPADMTAPVVATNGGVTFEDVAVDGPANGATPIHAEDGTVILRRVSATSSGVQPLDAELADVDISDSRFAVTAGTSFAAVVHGGTIFRSVFDGGPDGAGLDLISNATVDSSLIIGGDYGIRVENADAEDAALQNLTIDVGQPGVADGSSAIAIEHRGGGSLRIDSSIIRERVAYTGSGTLECTYDDVGRADLNDATCRTTAGHNTTTPAEQLFVDAAHGDWKLRTDSPARDRGSEGGVTADQSPFDLAGAPRVAFDLCNDVARRDQGAYELPVVCPVGNGNNNGDGNTNNGSGTTPPGGTTTGPTPPPPGPGPIVEPPKTTNVAPVLRSLKLRRVGRRLQASVRVSEACAVRFVLQRKVGKRWKTIKRVATTRSRAGTLKLKLPLRAVPKGRLRLTAQATDTQGAKSKPATSRVLRVR